MMKRFFVAIAALTASVSMFAQAQITTKKVKIEDFTEKTTKIVLTGNAFFDNELQSVMKNTWTISPYEFCSLADFESLKGSSDWYFLLTVQSMFKKETAPGIDMLSLVKGGDGAAKGIDKMLEVVSVPLCASEDPSGREFVFLEALIDIIQNHVLVAMKKDLAGGLGGNNMKRFGAGGTDIVFSIDDLAFSSDKKPAGNAIFVDEDEADSMMEEGRENTLLSYIVAPSEPVKGSFCYKMLIDAKSHKLHYFRKQKISAGKPVGFLAVEVARICAR